ncbi:hypothetical protein LXA43DRAFT_704618 [Ganoderma leucocontextum]|nr:hypothetical protein LXA43DRAFT_704618 [Ganoderma leucocontextum]
MWNNGYLGSVYVVGFAHYLVFILATAYPTPQISLPSSPFLARAFALARCLVFARRRALVHILATPVACLRLCPSLRNVNCVPPRSSARPRHLSVCSVWSSQASSVRHRKTLASHLPLPLRICTLLHRHRYRRPHLYHNATIAHDRIHLYTTLDRHLHSSHLVNTCAALVKTCGCTIIDFLLVVVFPLCPSTSLFFRHASLLCATPSRYAGSWEQVVSAAVRLAGGLRCGRWRTRMWADGRRRIGMGIRLR